MKLGSERTRTQSKAQAIGAREFFETYATSVLLHACTLLQGVLLARALGAEGRGEFAAVMLWPTILANIGTFGTGLATTRAAAASRESIDAVARAGILIGLILSIVTLGVGWFLIPALMPDSNDLVSRLAQIYLVLYVPSFILSSNLAGLDQGQGNFRRLNFFRLLQSPIYVGLLLLLIGYARIDLRSSLGALLLAAWVTTLGRLALVARETSLLGPVASPFDLLRHGMPYATTNLLGQLIHRGDRILLLWLLTERDLGLYVVAFSAASVLSNLPQSMGIVSLTISARENPGEGFVRIAQIFRSAVIVSVSLGFLQAAAIFFLLPLVYGSEFSGARAISIILAAGVLVRSIASVLGQAIRGQGKPLYGIKPNLAALVVLFGVALTLHSFFGVIGVALGYLAAQIARTAKWLSITVNHYENATFSDMLPSAQDISLVSNHMMSQITRVFTRLRCILKLT